MLVYVSSDLVFSNFNTGIQDLVKKQSATVNTIHVVVAIVHSHVRVPMVHSQQHATYTHTCITVYVQIFEAHNLRELLISSISRKQFSRIKFRVYSILKFRELNFRGLLGIRENRENYAPRKFGRIRYIYSPTKNCPIILKFIYM